MTDDALERLKQRQRPIVTDRDTKLSHSLDTSTPRYLDTKKSLHSDIPVQPQPEIQTKQTTMRLDAIISDRLSDLCKQHGISREVLIEALLVEFENNPDLQHPVLNEAQTRHAQRLQEANRKRAQTMMEKFGR